jgi:hypothetical protein
VSGKWVRLYEVLGFVNARCRCGAALAESAGPVLGEKENDVNVSFRGRGERRRWGEGVGFLGVAFPPKVWEKRFGVLIGLDCACCSGCCLFYIFWH